MCLNEEQAQHGYEAVQSGKPVQPYMSNVELDQLTPTNKDVNPYHVGLHAACVHMHSAAWRAYLIIGKWERSHDIY